MAHSQTSIEGVYHRRSGNPEGGNTFFIFNDHRFAVAFFGGVITGTWTIEGSQVLFTPHVSEHQFYLYGRHDKNIKGSRVCFQGFQHAPTAIGLDQVQDGTPMLTRVFNDDPNCVDYPSVAEFEQVPVQITLAEHSGQREQTNAGKPIYAFDNTEKYNNFIAYYIREDNDRRPFAAMFKSGKLFFGQDRKEGSVKQAMPTSGEDIEFIKQVLDAPTSTEKVFYGPLYRQSEADVNDRHNWKFDSEKNAFINFLNYVDGEENRPNEQDAYNRITIVYQYNILKLGDKKNRPFATGQKPLFVATCN